MCRPSLFCVNIYIYIYISTLHVNYFVCFPIYYMSDGSVACISLVITSLVTGRNKYDKVWNFKTRFSGKLLND